MAFKFVNGRIIDDSKWGSQTGTPSNNLFNLDFTPLTNYGSVDFSNKALWWKWPLDLNKKIDVTGNKPVVVDGVTTPYQDDTQQKTQLDLNNLSSMFGNAGNTMILSGAMMGNRGLYNAGIATNGLTRAGSYLSNWQSRNDIDERIKKATVGKSGFEAAQISKLINDEAKTQNLASGAGAIGSIADAGRQMFYSDQAMNDSDVTSGINTGYDAISSSLMGFSPVGTIVGGAMKAGAFLGDMAQSMGGGTDQMTTTDQIMDSNLFSWNIGLVNGFGGKKANHFGINQDVIAGVGGDYGGSTKDIYTALSLSDKKYGLFSSGARRDANTKMGLARSAQNKMNDIWKGAKDRFDISANTSQLNYLNYSNQVNGTDYTALRVKEGGKLERVRRICFKQGGTIEQEWEPVITDTVEEFKQGGVIDWEPDLYEPEFKNGGVIEWEPELTIEEYKEGGKIEEPLTSQKNVIPDGALHKNKHHMENTDGLTLKGIPVIDNNGEQQAEIELNEIIFSLEVTKELEKLYHKYENDDITSKEKDELAIEAGKLLVQEILFNTEDNTGLIDTLKNGGKINGNVK